MSNSFSLWKRKDWFQSLSCHMSLM